MNARIVVRGPRRVARTCLALCLSILCVGCAIIPVSGVAGAGMVRSKVARQEAPPIDSPAVAAVVDGNTAFALDLYRALYSPRENLMLSPHSISVALAMTLAGARDETESQMADTLHHYGVPQTELHAAFNALDAALSATSNGEKVTLRLANAVWGQQDIPFQEAYLDTLAAHYGAGMRVADFAQSAKARDVINKWVSDETMERIEELLPPDAITKEVSLVLANAVYLQAAWQHPFRETATREGTFTRPNSSEVRAPMMTHIAPFGYAERHGAQAVELPYAGGDLSMVVLLPPEGAFEAYAGGLDAVSLAGLLGALEPMLVQVTMPRFAFESASELKKPLIGLGMQDAFTMRADFSGIDGTRELFIDQVYHQAAITVDEGGTEAAAGSAVVVNRKGPAFDAAVRLDRPFVVVVRHIETGAILFLGHVVDPTT